MKNGKKILIAEDETDILEFLNQLFVNEGFEVIMAKDGIQAIKLANIHFPDVFLLDIKMPNLEGTAVCEQLRHTDDFKATPIVFLTAQNTEAMEMEAFRLGANDFIAKPIKPKALIARINKLLIDESDAKKIGEHQKYLHNRITQLGKVVLNHDEYKIITNGKEINLARKEFQIIELLASKPGKVFSRYELFKKVWGDNLSMTDRTIDVHIRKIRIKAGDDFIKTIKGVGFKVED